MNSEFSSRSFEVCPRHNKIKNVFCKNCKEVLCSDCLTEDHPGHRFHIIDDVSHSAITENECLDAKYKTTIQSFKEAIQTIHFTSTSVEVRACKVSEEVHAAFKKYKYALKERERDILLEIDQIKLKKIENLQKQKAELNLIFFRLTKTSNFLSESLSLKSDIAFFKKKAENDLKQIEFDQIKLTPVENNNISFKPSHNTNLLNAIQSTGSVIIVPDRNFKEFRGVVKNDSKPIINFGCQGNRDGQFSTPWGVCCDKLGNIIVGDQNNHRIQVFNPKGNFLYKFGCKGSAPGQFSFPMGVATNPQGNLVVADRCNHRIQLFKLDGTFVSQFGQYGSKNGQFKNPWDVACNSMAHIVVSDSLNHRIQLFTCEGVFLNEFGFENNAGLRGVTFTSNGSILVADRNNNRLAIVNFNFNNVQFVGEKGTGEVQFALPHGVCCDAVGNLIVSEYKNNRIQVLGSNGSYLWELGKFGQAPGELNGPHGICLNLEGRIVVVEWNNHRVQVL